MRHQVRGRKLGRTKSHRIATMRALSSALIKNKKIVTTLAKAKELRRYVEPLVTRAKKDDNSHNRRQVFSFLNDKEAVKALYDDIMPVVGDRPGGYTRVIKLGRRQGDGAPTAMIEFVDFNDVKPEGKTTGKKRTRRAGRKKSTTPAVETKTKDTDTKEEKPAEAEVSEEVVEDTDVAKKDTAKAESTTTTEATDDSSSSEEAKEEKKEDK